MEKLWHMGITAKRRPALFSTETRRRAAVRKVVELASTMLVAFCLVYEHAHLMVFCREKLVGNLRRSLRLGLQPIVQQRLERVWREPISSSKHTISLLKYHVEQVTHHELDEHPALFSGSYLQDIVGARALPGLRLRLAEAAPDLRVRQIYGWAGLPPVPIRPASDDEVRRCGVHRLKEAAAAVSAASPALGGRTLPEVRAKRVVVHLADQLGHSSQDVRQVLGTTRSGLHRLRSLPADRQDMEATRMRLALEEAVVLAGTRQPDRKNNVG